MRYLTSLHLDDQEKENTLFQPYVQVNADNKQQCKDFQSPSTLKLGMRMDVSMCPIEHVQ